MNTSNSKFIMHFLTMHEINFKTLIIFLILIILSMNDMLKKPFNHENKTELVKNDNEEAEKLFNYHLNCQVQKIFKLHLLSHLNKYVLILCVNFIFQIHLGSRYRQSSLEEWIKILSTLAQYQIQR